MRNHEHCEPSEKQRVRVELKTKILDAAGSRARYKGITLSQYLEKLVEDDRRKFLY